MTPDFAAAIAGRVARRELGARAVVAAALDRIAALDPRVGAFTDVTAARALAAAEALDARLDRGEAAGPLAGVPFAVKNLIDVAGLPTRAGSRINRERVPAARDGALVRRLEAAGAILVGALNMGEYAYDFTGENVHDGPSRNPHALAHMSGGSSGGSGAALAAGLVPLTLGSDTNGSIRVPSAFCGVFGLKPTYGRLTRAGSFPFVGSLDHLGPMARSVADLALAYDAMQGPDPEDPVATRRPPEPVTPLLGRGAEGLRVAVAGGYFARGGDPEAFEAVARVARALGADATVEIPEAARARAAAYLISAAEGAALHLDRLRARPGDFDPAVRDRLLAGAMIPAPHVERAQRFRRWYAGAVAEVFAGVDAILAPATPCRAPRGGETVLVLDGVAMPLRPNLGVFTQPISFVGLPVAAVPVWLDDGLPLGVQVIAAPWREDVALRIAHALEQAGVARAPVAPL
ncbi:amidohydrolase, AtzE family [Methylobacterium sp. 4-46]|uniref:AtzE family amidohydrolase n=1 Tax=unclassified Methylobacterium TaxID=2615210 RepID=UPI000165C8A2|nr:MULTISPECIES: AtzE family amidohydrolase [Methylobacterium]ACA16603.1 amidohydrolase, AtzE family [Methylobacterium sp. 4-46]WFT82307.1 AtzE family amidohydrolase [Methylobacterium nodulans]